MHRLLPTFALLAAGCACERGIGLSGNQDATDTYDSIPSWDVVGPEAPTVGDPIWDPPIENLGDIGWRDSVGPLCPPTEGPYHGYDVWSDFRGVFALIGVTLGGGIALNDIFFNSGSGWIHPFADTGTPDDWQSLVMHITGLPGNDIFGWGDGVDSFFVFTSEGVEEQSADVGDVYAVNEDLAYAVVRASAQLLEYDGSSWGPYPGEPLPYIMHSVWANEETIYCAGENGIVVSNSTDEWTVHDTGTLSNFLALWGFSRDDIWASGIDPVGLYHYNGSIWQTIEWPTRSNPEAPCGGDATIHGFWGMDGVLFFHTGWEFVVWDGITFNVLGYWPAHYNPETDRCEGGLLISGIWGNSPTEVFLAVTDNAHESTECGQEHLLWWDGTSFHWF